MAKVDQSSGSCCTMRKPHERRSMVAGSPPPQESSPRKGRAADMKRIVPLVLGASLMLPGAAMAQGSGCTSQDQTYGVQDCQAASDAAQAVSTTSTTSTV